MTTFDRYHACSTVCLTACTTMALPVEILPEDSLSEAVEDAIRATLPVLPGLLDEMSGRERLKVFEREVAYAFSDFVSRHGDPFGCMDGPLKGMHPAPSKQNISFVNTLGAIE